MTHVYGIEGDGERHVREAERIANETAARQADSVDREGRFPLESVRALGEAGLLGLCVAAEHGGAGQGPRTFAAVAEELARACGSTAMVYVMHVTAAQAIATSPTLKGKDAILRDIAAGKHLTTLALSETGSRSHFWAPVSKLEPSPSTSGYVTSAHKSWVTSAHHASSYVSTAQRPGAQSPLESTTYLVHAKRDDAQVRPAGGFDGLGLRGNDSAPVLLEGLRVDEGDLVSRQGEGAKTKLEVILPWFAIGTAAMAHGLCRAAVEATAGHLQNAALEHLGQKLRDLPTLRARVAQMAMATERSRALLGYTLGEVESPSQLTPIYVLESRLSALETAIEVTDLAMKTCGGAAFSRRLPVERLFRDARAGWVMAPTADHLQEFLGRALTGLPLF